MQIGFEKVKRQKKLNKGLTIIGREDLLPITYTYLPLGTFTLAQAINYT